jgi:hypothetical protein
LLLRSTNGSVTVAFVSINVASELQITASKMFRLDEFSGPPSCLAVSFTLILLGADGFEPGGCLK